MIVPFIFSLKKLINVNNLFGLLLCSFLVFMTIQQFARSCYIKSSYEWYYDENTFEVLKELKYIYEIEGRKEPINLDSYWIFHPSLSFYVTEKYAKYVNLEHYHSDLDKNSKNEFYYIQREDFEKMKENYNIFKEFGWGTRILIKRK